MLYIEINMKEIDQVSIEMNGRLRKYLMRPCLKVRIVLKKVGNPTF